MIVQEVEDQISEHVARNIETAREEAVASHVSESSCKDWAMSDGVVHHWAELDEAVAVGSSNKAMCMNAVGNNPQMGDAAVDKLAEVLVVVRCHVAALRPNLEDAVTLLEPVVGLAMSIVT